MHLDTPRLTIRSFVPEDAADLQEILGDAKTMEYSEPPYDLEKTKQFLASFCIARGGGVVAVHRETNKVIGYILFSKSSRESTSWAGFSIGTFGGKATPLRPVML